MQFDEAGYVQEFLRKAGRGQSLPDDLLTRYAITLPASDAEIGAQLKAVRACWTKHYGGSNFAAKAAKLCRAEDERLRQQYDSAMEKASWWQLRRDEQSAAAQESIGVLAAELRRAYGELGVVTAARAGSLAESLGLAQQDAIEAVGQAGLTLVAAADLPQVSPIATFSALQRDMAECAASSVPELVHPASGPFRLLDRYECVGDPQKRLDVLAVEAQIATAERRGNSATDTARRSALQALRTALRDGVDLREVALFHLMKAAEQRARQSAALTAESLERAGLERHDAVALAVMLFDQAQVGQAAGLDQIRKLIRTGGLGEASQIAASLPADSSVRPEAVRLVDEARQRLMTLLAAATEAKAVPDEAEAARLLREAALISAEDAAQALAAVPLPPPANLRAICDGMQVKLYWQAATGHDGDTRYEVYRSEQRTPAAPGDGSVVYRGAEQSCADAHAPVARELHYCVFAVGSGRQSSRPAPAVVTLVPPVTQLQAEAGPAEVTVHWSAHPDVHAVLVTSVAGGRPPVAVPTQGGTGRLTGLAEGETQDIEVVAVYRAPGGAELRSAVAQISATPRSEARPIPRLRAKPVGTGGAVRLLVSWIPVDKSDVRIMRSDAPPRWPFGTWVSHDDMTACGQEVTGRRFTERGEERLEAEVPAGVHHLVAFSIGGTGIVRGHAVAVGITEPVRQLAVTLFASHATVSWEWPDTAQLAEVTWKAGDDADCFVISRAEYRSGGGARVPLGGSPVTIEVRAVVVADGTNFTSPPAVEVTGVTARPEISYAVARSLGMGPLGGRPTGLTFQSAQGCHGVRIQFVARPGPVMPTTSDGTFVLAEKELSLAPGGTAQWPVDASRVKLKRPYWVRCFVVGGEARLLDPPISTLKAS
jgi:hypothetical protein